MISSDINETWPTSFGSLSLKKHTEIWSTLAGERRPTRRSRGQRGVGTPGGGCGHRGAASVLGADVLLRTQGVCRLPGTHIRTVFIEFGQILSVWDVTNRLLERLQQHSHRRVSSLRWCVLWERNGRGSSGGFSVIVHEYKTQIKASKCELVWFHVDSAAPHLPAVVS